MELQVSEINGLVKKIGSITSTSVTMNSVLNGFKLEVRTNKPGEDKVKAAMQEWKQGLGLEWCVDFGQEYYSVSGGYVTVKYVVSGKYIPPKKEKTKLDRAIELIELVVNVIIRNSRR